MSGKPVSERVLNIVREAAAELGDFTSRDLYYRVLLSKATIADALRALVNKGELEVVKIAGKYKYRYKGKSVDKAVQSTISSFDSGSDDSTGKVER